MKFKQLLDIVKYYSSGAGIVYSPNMISGPTDVAQNTVIITVGVENSYLVCVVILAVVARNYITVRIIGKAYAIVIFGIIDIVTITEIFAYNIVKAGRQKDPLPVVFRKAVVDQGISGPVRQKDSTILVFTEAIAG